MPLDDERSALKAALQVGRPLHTILADTQIEQVLGMAEDPEEHGQKLDRVSDGESRVP